MRAPPREIAGFDYDPTTNRYYRRIPDRHATEAQRDATQRSITSTVTQAMMRLTEHAGLQYQWNAHQWSFHRQKAPPLVLQREDPLSWAAKQKIPPMLLQPIILETSSQIIPTMGFAHEGLVLSGPRRHPFKCSWQDGRTICVDPISSAQIEHILGDRLVRHFVYRHPKIAISCDLTIDSPPSRQSCFALSLTEGGTHHSPQTDEVSLLGFLPKFHTGAFNDDGNVLLLASHDGLFRVDFTGESPRCARMQSDHHKATINGMCFLPKTAHGYLISFSEGRAVLYSDERRSTTFRIGGSSVKNFFPSSDLHTILMETFHNNLLLFDRRFPLHPLLNINPMGIAEDLRHFPARYCFREADHMLFAAFRETCYLLAWDLRKPNLPSELWQMTDWNINDLFLSPSANSLLRPHLTIG